MEALKRILREERGQGGIEYLLLLAALIGLAAVVAYYFVRSYSSAGQSASGAATKAAGSASQKGVKAWEKYNP
ncbi:class III signal peptide-containing protein [Methanopyrus sp.]